MIPPDGGGQRDSRRPQVELSLKDLSADRARALELTPVSRETIERLDRFVATLLAWQPRVNLISRSSEASLWTRHVADSLQLLPLAPEARVWADLGTGGGFPGVVIACALADIPGAEVHLVESNGKKAAFLREAANVTGAPITVHQMRIEEFVEKTVQTFDAVTARALAPLPQLLPMAYPLLKEGALGLFPKGQDVGSELTEAAKCWRVQAGSVQSKTDVRGQIVVVRGLAPKPREKGSRPR
jgi:16S rRNA (guanine527-N7)-methyltransferase